MGSLTAQKQPKLTSICNPNATRRLTRYIGAPDMEPHRVEEYCSLMWRAAVQDRTADMAAEVAHEADRTRQTYSANTMWRIAHRCRIRALKLRVDATIMGEN
jgi:hypothetical protein